MEEYFDFQEAADETQGAFPDFASDQVEANQDDSNDCVESLFFDKSFSLPSDPPFHNAEGTAPPTSSANDDETFKIGDDGVYPLYRPKEPCDRCRSMGLECFLAHRGTFVNGCTICVSMYRECSFTHKKPTGVYMDTLATLTEDTQELVGGLTGRKTLKSLTYTTSLDVSERPRKAGARFGREATKILKTWLAEHARHPYPTEEEKNDLKQRTGLKRSQVSNWLANARRRGKVPSVSDASSPVLGAIDIPSQQNRDSLDLSELNPFERWRISPPEHEAASASAIAKAIQSPPFTPTRAPSQSGTLAHSRQTSTRRTSSNDDSSFSMFQAPSISSFDNETNRSSMSDFSHLSANTGKSSITSKDRRRRRRNPLGPRSGPPSGQGSTSASKPRPQRIFQCTFCADSFPSKYDWQRHEKSLHLALERWTCAPKGPTFNDPATGTPICVFCQRPDPTPQHLEVHNYLTCADKTASERTFYRKDHLRQHLRLAHGAAFHPPTMDAWKTTTDSIRSSCGFCPAKFTSWSARADHLAAHFRNGMDMSRWEGDWGFEPFVARLVENAVPPYLVAQERKSMDPYVAKARRPSTSTSVGSAAGGEGGPAELTNASTTTASLLNHSNCWNELSRCLREYISDCLSRGVVPTDAQLQAQARLVVFGDEDPWNQTAADNPIWLGILKREFCLDDGGVSSKANAAVSAESTMEELRMDPPYAVRGGLRKKPNQNLPSQQQQQTQQTTTSGPAKGKGSAITEIAVSMPASVPMSLPMSMAMPSSSTSPMMIDSMEPMDFEFDFGQLDLDDLMARDSHLPHPHPHSHPHSQIHSQHPSPGLGAGVYETASGSFHDQATVTMGMVGPNSSAADFGTRYFSGVDTTGFSTGTVGPSARQDEFEQEQYLPYGYGHR